MKLYDLNKLQSEKEDYAFKAFMFSFLLTWGLAIAYFGSIL